jgi:hypothetical protein
VNPFALTAEERAGAMMEPATKPDVGAFMDNLGALRAMISGRSSRGGAWLDEDTAGTVTVGEGGAGVIRRARNYIAEEPGKTYGAILPLKKDDATGDLSFAIPGFARDSATGLLDMLEGRMTPEASMALLDIPIGGLLHAGVTGARQTPETLAAIRAYHGSPHRFDKFSLDKIGTGEGAQAYGHGLYFAESEGVAKSYREGLTTAARTGQGRGRHSVFSAGGQDLPVTRTVEADIAHTMQKYGIDPNTPDGADWLSSEIGARNATAARDVDAEAVKSLWQAGPIDQRFEDGALYTTKLNVEADDLLDWDKPLSEQSEKVRAALEKRKKEHADLLASIPMHDGSTPFHEYDAKYGKQLERAAQLRVRDGITGEEFIRSLGGGEQASRLLREMGIPGIRYLDQGSRGAGEGTRNFVIFDDSLIDIEAVDGKAVGLDMGQDARMARAKEMGFDTDTPLFHGTDRDITEFRVSKGGEIGPGVYVTRDATQAGEYARPSYGGPYPEGANVTKTVVKGKMKNMERGEWVALRGEIMDRLREENGGEWDSKFVKQAEKEIMAELEGEGFVGIYLKNPTGKASLMYDQGVVFDPANIRSVHAAFDPAKKKSADLLAASAGGGVAASAVTTAASDRKDRKNKP